MVERPSVAPKLDSKDLRPDPRFAERARPVLVEANGKLVSAVTALPTFVSGTDLWRGFTMEILETPASEIPPRAALLRHIVCTIDSEDPLRFFWKENGREQKNLAAAGDHLIRSQQELIGFRWDNAARALILGIEPETMNLIAGELLPEERIEFQEFFGTPDSYLHALMRALAADLEKGCPTGAILGESLCTSIAVHTLRRYGVIQPKQRDFQHGLSGARLRWVLDYIESRLASDLSLFELASVAGVGPFYLARLFKASTRMTLHQYLLSRRIERAKHLLARTNIDVAAIALAVGFRYASHFSQTFRRRTGSTPFEFRASCQ